ncbi:hypothetical protein K490DRAFT_65167 [Saccharata proteae CBS 121410]|uniref:Uncharacterized protein n=1 Tax=Saccharata proteae CBS 121410 TaxID=1314787 RepID=A0A9P4HXK2_9PEZI|nr:hypothetical protein K490DRAFT_65167 [Saccharata proteae CBS 121410]
MSNGFLDTIMRAQLAFRYASSRVTLKTECLLDTDCLQGMEGPPIYMAVQKVARVRKLLLLPAPPTPKLLTGSEVPVENITAAIASQRIKFGLALMALAQGVMSPATDFFGMNTASEPVPNTPKTPDQLQMEPDRTIEADIDDSACIEGPKTDAVADTEEASNVVENRGLISMKPRKVYGPMPKVPQFNLAHHHTQFMTTILAVYDKLPIPRMRLRFSSISTYPFVMAASPNVISNVSKITAKSPRQNLKIEPRACAPAVQEVPAFKFSDISNILDSVPKTELPQSAAAIGRPDIDFSFADRSFAGFGRAPKIDGRRIVEPLRQVPFMELGLLEEFMREAPDTNTSALTHQAVSNLSPHSSLGEDLRAPSLTASTTNSSSSPPSTVSGDAEATPKMLVKKPVPTRIMVKKTATGLVTAKVGVPGESARQAKNRQRRQVKKAGR